MLLVLFICSFLNVEFDTVYCQESGKYSLYNFKLLIDQLKISADIFIRE